MPNAYARPHASKAVPGRMRVCVCACTPVCVCLRDHAVRVCVGWSDSVTSLSSGANVV